MPDYAAMYAVLFNAMTRIDEIIHQAQQATEDMYILAPEAEIHLLHRASSETAEGKKNSDDSSCR